MLDPTSVTVGAAIGTLAWTALSFALASRKDRKAAVKRRQFAEMQRAIFDVQDAVAMGLSADTCNDLRTLRDRAAAAYLEG